MTSKRYLSRVRRRLTCSAASRRRLLAQGEQMVEDFLQENPGADGDALTAAFGEPEEFARQMLDTLEPGEVAAAQRRRRLVRRVSAALVALALVVTTVICLVKCFQMQEVVNGDFYVIQFPARNLTKEEYDALVQEELDKR